ncbi:MAG TPA: winged helix-turn-helix transcriptional regulator [Methanoregulaceae archaeon]|nr:winged helix-turn-helix transcriptional regulator [Methanoregulaceae archaeon]HOV67281.1 winged helix-turn-helix transcriptional regulator [Methanoregulaceae archaeon]HQJ87319.1 winged helix-turn-helix transcriptional regulator [Methanoregulaceae archaeon]
MAEERRKAQLLQLFSNITSKTKIVEPMKKIHGSLRDRDAVEREIALVMREVLDQGFFKTKLKPLQLAKLVSDFYAGRNDTEIARDLGDEKLSKTVARARIRLKLFRDLDFRMPFDRQDFRDMVDAGLTMKEIAERLNVSPSTLREYRHVLEQEEDHTLDVYLERIKDIMEDRDLTEQMTHSATNDGLGEAIDITEAELAELS